MKAYKEIEYRLCNRLYGRLGFSLYWRLRHRIYGPLHRSLCGHLYYQLEEVI